MALDGLHGWTASFDDLMARIAGRFYRAEPRRRVRSYLLALLSPIAGKNGWAIAETAGEATPWGVQRLLNGSCWDPDQVRDDLRDYVREHLGDPDGVLIVDETGFLKNPRGRRAGRPGAEKMVRGGWPTDVDALWSCEPVEESDAGTVGRRPGLLLRARESNSLA